MILDADSRAGLAAVQSLGKLVSSLHVGIRDSGKDSPTLHSRWCKNLHRQPPAESIVEAHSWLRQLDACHNFSLIVPTTEASLLWFRQLPVHDPLRERAILPSDDALDTALSKESTHALAKSIGLPVPSSRLLARGTDSGIAPHSGFPCVLKPVSSKILINSRLVTLAPIVVRDEQAYRSKLASWLPYTDVQEQQWVPGHGVGVEMVYSNGRVIASFMHERLHEMPLTGGGSTWRRATEPVQHLLELSERLLDELQWHGVAMVEWRCSEGSEPRLMEINPRLWGSLPLTIAAGVDVPAILLDMSLGSIPPITKQWKIGITARNVSADIRWLAANLRADHSDPLLLTRPLLPTLAGWLRFLTGREVFDGWSLRDPAVALSELSELGRGLLNRPLAAIRRRLQLRSIARAHALRFTARAQRQKPIESLLFLCYGNICRSPFAAELARRQLPELHIASAGFHPQSKRSSPEHLVTAAREHSVDLSNWSSRQVDAGMLAGADCIVVMDLSHLAILKANHPEAIPRTTLLGLFEPTGPAEMEDPYTLSPEQTKVVLQHMVRAMDGLTRSLKS